MISVGKARELVLQQCLPLNTCRVDISRALHRVLAENVRADRDIPTMTKSLMDGFAVRAGDLRPGKVALDVVGEIWAGQVAGLSVHPGQAARIMTGAQLPDGADTVVPVEQTDAGVWNESVQRTVTITDSSLVSGNNVMLQGTIAISGDILVSIGTRLSPAALAVLAEVGVAHPLVYRPVRLAVIPTGDEVVAIERAPGPGKLRNSNGPMLTALACQAGCEAVELGIGRDDREHLRELITRGLEYDVLVLSGGVSAGTRDLVPGVLTELGVEQVFHRIRIRPGKPLWFGTYSRPARRTLVFGLPGNPVSSFICFYSIVRPALTALVASKPVVECGEPLPLLNPSPAIGNRDTYWPVVRRIDVKGNEGLEILDWHGSADLCTLSRADGLAFLPADGTQREIGDCVEFFPIH